MHYVWSVWLDARVKALIPYALYISVSYCQFSLVLRCKNAREQQLVKQVASRLQFTMMKQYCISWLGFFWSSATASLASNSLCKSQKTQKEPKFFLCSTFLADAFTSVLIAARNLKKLEIIGGVFERVSFPSASFPRQTSFSVNCITSYERVNGFYP